jgi:hypothetical protein
VLLETPTAVDDVHIITDLGAVFVQAKNSLPLSDKPGSELASVADQFVRQYREGARENGGRRELNAGRDRLILAVGEGAPATVTNDLREALERNRTGSATNMPGALTHALQVLTEQLDATWFAVTNAAITSTDQQALLALCSVLVVGDGQRQVVEEGLSAVVASAGHEATLFDLLFTWASDAAQRGTGGDAAAIRRFLQGRVTLAAPPSFQQDLERLRTYSAETLLQLERFTALPSPEGPVRLARPVVARVAEAAHLGTLALTGEPGAGKSAVLVALANELQPQHSVVCLSVETGAATLDLLRAEIGLRHPVVELLRHMPRSGTAYLLLDALDASRGGTAEVTYRKLIEAVTALPGWHVVASVRSFDLRLGMEWQRLFRGVAPFAEYAARSFPLVRHLHLGLLSEAERADLARQSPSLDKALLAGGSRLEMLAHNPFNLALLGELLVAGIPAQDLTAVFTRGQLLTRYWEQRVEAMGTPGAVALARLVEQMLQAKALSIHRTRVEPATALSLDHLQQNGVLAATGSGQIGFRHHVLFDYAVATLLLVPTGTSIPVYLRREQAVGLLLAPALGYWVEELKRTREDFWAFVTGLVADTTLDPVVRVEVARLAVEAVQPGEELTELTTILNGNGELAARSFQQLAGALLTKTEGGHSFAGDPWAHLVGSLMLVDSAQLGALQALLGALLAQPLEAGSLRALGTAARALYARVGAEQRLTLWLAQVVIPHVVRTYSTDTVASRRLLRIIFSDERFEHFGHLEVPVLAREVLTLAASDADFTVELFARVFQGHNFSRTQATPRVKGWIFALESNAAQDFDLAQYHLAKAFPALLLQSPATAMRAFGAMLRGKWDTKNWRRQLGRIAKLPVGDVLYSFEEDDSSVWAWELSEGRHTAFASIHDAFMQWVGNVQDKQVLTCLPGWVLHQTPIALAWRVLFAAGALQGPTLGLLLWPAAAQQLALASASTQQQASQLLATIYPHLEPSLRVETEDRWLGWDFATFADPDRQRTRTLTPLFAALGEALLATDEAREYLAARYSDAPPRTDHNFLERGSRTTRTFWPEVEADEGSDRPEQPLLRAVQAAQVEAQTAPSPQSVVHLDAALQQLDQVLSTFPVDGSGADQRAAILAEGFGTLILAAGETTVRTKALIRLLELTNYPAPAADAGTEVEFAAGGIQSYTQGRTEAAEALAGLVAVPQLWSQIAARFEFLLLHDLHPEVRWRMLTALPALEDVDAHAFWKLTRKFAELEQNPALCQRGLILLQRLVHLVPARVEPFILTLIRKAESPPSRSNISAHLLAFLALDEVLPASQRLLHTWLAEYALREQQLNSVLFTLQDRFTLGYGVESPALVSVRSRAIEFALLLTATVEPAIVAWTSADREPTAEEITAVKLLDEVAEQLYFALFVDGLPVGLTELEAQRHFLRDYTPLMRKLSALGTPKAVHHLLEILNELVAASPAECFDLLSEAMLRTTGVAKYEHEWLGVARFVELIGRYLADYRFVFSSAARQKRLVDCIAVFVEAGWSEARRLFHDLPGMLQ